MMRRMSKRVQARHAEFGNSLRTATGLETLRLDFGDGDISMDTVLMERSINVPVMWEGLVETMTWKNLCSLELHVVTTSESCM